MSTKNQSDAAAITPPAKLVEKTKGYGPANPLPRELTPLERLRKVLGLTQQARAERVIGEAADRLERLLHA